MIENTELEAARMLLEAGVKVGKYHIKELTLGMLDEITAIRLKMGVDEEETKANPIRATNKAVHDNAHLAARVVAIGLIGRGRLKRKLFAGIYARYLMEKLKPSLLYELMDAITLMSNPADFMHSIRLASGIRMTAPMPDPNLIATISKAPGGNEATS